MTDIKTTSTTLSPSDADVRDAKLWDSQQKVVDGRSFVIVPIRALFDARVNDRCLRVLAAYCSYAQKSYGDHRLTMVGQTRIAREIGISQSTVSKYVIQLRHLGYMKLGKRPRRKYGTAQTHLVFFGKPIKNGGPGNPDKIIELMDAMHDPNAEAPPVPVNGINGTSAVRTDRWAA